MEAKATISGISIVMVCIVMGFIIFTNFLLGFLLIMSIGLMIFGDILIGMKIVDFKPLFEPTPRNLELMELELLNGRMVFFNTTKGAYGKRSFRIHNEDATVINDGKSNFTLPNGNRGFRALENFDRNVDPHLAKALQQMEGADIKEIYYQARSKLKNEQRSRS